MKTRILIIGQGNIGTFLGAALSTNENEVKHLIHHTPPKRTSVALQCNDRRVTKQKIKKGTVYTYQTLFDLQEIRAFDFIFIPVGHNQWRQVIEMLNPYLMPHQILILSGNVWDDFDWFEKNIINPYIFAFPNFGGAIIDNQLQGWLTANFTLGISQTIFSDVQKKVENILQKAGFKPVFQPEIKDWLMTHFAYNAGMLAEAAHQNGYQNMTKNWASLRTMFQLIKECMFVLGKMGIETQRFAEGKEAMQPVWWNVLKTYLIFHIPGIAQSADATKDITEWFSYLQKIQKAADKLDLHCPLISSYKQYWQI